MPSVLKELAYMQERVRGVAEHFSQLGIQVDRAKGTYHLTGGSSTFSANESKDPKVLLEGLFRKLAEEIFEGTPVEASVPAGGRHLTKAALLTVGVHATQAFWRALEQSRKGLASETQRILFEAGVETLDRRLDEENSQVVFRDFEKAFEEYSQTNSIQKMVRVPRSAYNTAKILAKEHGKSMSHIARICMAFALSP